MADANRVTVDLTTGIGTLSFPHIFASTKTKGKPGKEDTYDIQIIIPKTQRDDLKAIVKAIKTVGEAKFGDNWRKYKNPLRDGDKEADDLGDDGMRKGDKYPERLGAYFLNARSTKPVGVVDRLRVPIEDPEQVYGGCKGKINVTFYPYSKEGNTGIGCSLNGVQKVADGEAFGGGKPSVESMFDMLEEDEGLDDALGDEPDEEPTPPPAKKAAAKKAPAKKTAAKKAVAKPELEPEADEDDLDADLDGLGDEDYDDLDGLDDEDS